MFLFIIIINDGYLVNNLWTSCPPFPSLATIQDCQIYIFNSTAWTKRERKESENIHQENIKNKWKNITQESEERKTVIYDVPEKPKWPENLFGKNHYKWCYGFRFMLSHLPISHPWPAFQWIRFYVKRQSLTRSHFMYHSST